jgi:uncharacterized protein with ParB-like and HNH nuclease domain
MLNIKTVNELRKEMDFFIPSYQRGYRWDKQQVLNLLNDIYDFMLSSSSDFYCLQPIVVKELQKEAATNHKYYEVIDAFDHRQDHTDLLE